MDPSLPRPAPPRSLLERLREWVVWFGPGRLAATAIAVIAVAVGGTWLVKGSPSRAENVAGVKAHTPRRSTSFSFCVRTRRFISLIVVIK